MNNKRQTIWLVSMLSLMVVLSAYYLFTEDASTNNVGGKEATQQSDTGKVSTSNADGISVTQIDPTEDEITSVQSNKESSGSAPKGAEDEAVLKGLANLNGNQLLDQKLYEQQVNVSKKAEELRATISNTKVSQEDAASAAEELSKLEDMDDRITNLQVKLLQDFDNAVVQEVNTNYKVIVLSDKLEKKQAVGIIDMATKELDVTPDRVSVQYVK